MAYLLLVATSGGSSPRCIHRPKHSHSVLSHSIPMFTQANFTVSPGNYFNIKVNFFLLTCANPCETITLCPPLNCMGIQQEKRNFPPKYSLISFKISHQQLLYIYPVWGENPLCLCGVYILSEHALFPSSLCHWTGQLSSLNEDWCLLCSRAAPLFRLHTTWLGCRHIVCMKRSRC